MKKVITIVLCFLLGMSFVLGSAWPGDAGTNIGINLQTGYEPSGIIWHPYYNALFTISDSGTISKMNLDGTGVTNWSIGGDLEGVTITDPTSKYIYVVVEYPYQLIQFDPTTGTKVKTISLTGVVPATNATNQGIEGVAYVPNGDHPYVNNSTEGLFYFGVQENGPIHVVNINFDNSTATLVNSFIPTSGRGDISDLFFNTETKILYVLYDGSNLLREIKLDNTFIAEYSVPGSEQEGFTMQPSYPNTTAIAFIAEDTPTKLMKYNNYPVSYPIVIPIDSDNDGISDEYDKCPGFDDKLDLDLDEIPDGCDLIDNRDNDNDGIINQYDTWPLGFEIPIQENLPTGFEASGIIFHPYYNALFLVSDKGTISKMNLDGTNVTNWTLAGDLEGITIMDPESKYIYVVVEYPYQLIQFDPTTGTKVKTISLTGIVPATNNSNLGIQGIAYVPEWYHNYSNIHNGLFYFGMQENGIVHLVNVDFENNNATLVDSFTPIANRTDISDLFFNTETQTLNVLYDSTNLLREIKLDNTLIKETSIPNKNIDGVTFLTSCPNTSTTLIIAEDAGKTMKYGNYPINCLPTPKKDLDYDGYFEDLDCKDNDPNINPGMPEILYNNKDDDCNSITLDILDADKDNYNSNIDCDDLNPLINPDMTEIINNNLDDDCDALTLDKPDSDNDGILDPYDKCPGFDDNADIDTDGIADGCDLSDDRDQDNDGLTNAQELIYGTNPLLADTDNGSVNDGQEIINKTNPLNPNDDVPIVIDPNIISSYTINSNATVLVNYLNNTQLTIDPFIGTSKINANTNSKKDRLIVTDGQYLSVYKRDSIIAQTKIKSGTSTTTMTVTNMGTYDKIIIQYYIWIFRQTRTYKLVNDVLTKI